MYSEQDKQFLKALKNQGVPAEEAFARLNKVRGQASPQPSQPQQNNGDYPGKGIVDFVGGAAKGVQDAATGVTSFITDSTIKPIAKAAIGGVVTGAKNLEGLGRSLWELPGAIQASGGDLDKPIPGLSEKMADINKSVTAPVQTDFFGNLNMNRADKSGNYDFLKSLYTEGGMAVDALSGAANIVAPFKSVGQAAARGAVQSGAKDIVENPESDAMSTAISAGLGGALSAGGFKLGDLLKSKKVVQGAAQKRAELAGLKDDTIKTLKTPKLGEQVLENLDQAHASISDPGLVNDPFQNVGQKQLKPAIEKLSGQNKALGQKLEKVLKNETLMLTTKTELDDFVGQLAEVGGKVKNGKVVFSTTSPITSEADIKALNAVYKDLLSHSNTGARVTKPLSAYDYNNLIKRITSYTDYDQKGLVPVGTLADKLIKGVRRTMSDSLKNQVKGTAPILEKMTRNYDLLDFFNPKLGENQSSATILRNLFSPAQKDALRPNLQTLEKLTGKAILDPTKAARAAMDIVGDPRGDSLIEVGKETAKGVKQGIMSALTRWAADPKKSAKALVKAQKYVPKVSPLANKGVMPQGINSLIQALIGNRN